MFFIQACQFFMLCWGWRSYSGFGYSPYMQRIETLFCFNFMILLIINSKIVICWETEMQRIISREPLPSLGYNNVPFIHSHDTISYYQLTCLPPPNHFFSTPGKWLHTFLSHLLPITTFFGMFICSVLWKTKIMFEQYFFLFMLYSIK